MHIQLCIVPKCVETGLQCIFDAETLHKKRHGVFECSPISYLEKLHPQSRSQSLMA